jgi:hypothetical protein
LRAGLPFGANVKKRLVSRVSVDETASLDGNAVSREPLRESLVEQAQSATCGDMEGMANDDESAGPAGCVLWGVVLNTEPLRKH